MHRSVTCMALVAVVGLGVPRQAAAPPDITDVMLSEVGSGFELVEEQPGSTGSLTRTFTNGTSELSIIGFAITSPPGPRVLFEAFTATEAGLDIVPAPEFELGSWLVAPGSQPGDGGFSAIVVASTEFLFSITLIQPVDDGLDGVPFVRDLARRHVEAGGGEPSDTPAPAREVDDADLLRFLPEAPPAGLGLSPEPMTVAGADDIDLGSVDSPEAAEFLNDRAKNVARVWAGPDLAVGVGITQYPYEIFAQAALGVAHDTDRSEGTVAITSNLRDAVAYNDRANRQVAVVFRRGDMVAIVLADYVEPAAEANAVTAALATADTVAAGLPPGGTSLYRFPDPPTRIVGLLLTAGFVTAAVAGSTVIARLRARRVRRRWWAESAPAAWPAPGTQVGQVIDLDADAAALRRRGRIVMIVQAVTVNIGVVALAGDFAWTGVGVAAAALLTGLGFSRWWLRHEHRLLGPAAPPRAFLAPRPGGAAVGLAAFAVLGVGVAYLLKGLRYLIFNPTLAQLKWSNLFGVTPRTVGVIFALGGLVTTAVGAVLYRLARSLARAGVKQVLSADPRPPILYLRSFGDDSLPLPTIASARRPLFELFSLRGADPFEEAVAWELDSYGPVVSVGRPGASLRSLGAAREHLSNETWQGEVADRMNDAGWIALAPGETEGLAWEVNEIVRGHHLAKTVFVFPPLAPSDLDRRWHHTSELLSTAGNPVGPLPVSTHVVHTLCVDESGAVRVTTASTRDEATYRSAVDRALSGLPSSQPAADAVAAR